MFEDTKKFKWSELTGRQLKIKTSYNLEDGVSITYGIDIDTKEVFILGKEKEPDIKRINLLIDVLKAQEEIYYGNKH